MFFPARRPRHGVFTGCDYGRANVEAAIKQALTLDLRRLRHPYGDGHTGERIAAHLAAMDLAALSVRKRNRY